MHSTDIQWSAILSWGYADNILRLKSKQSEPPINFIQCSQLHQVDKNQTREPAAWLDLHYTVQVTQFQFLFLFFSFCSSEAAQIGCVT